MISQDRLFCLVHLEFLPHLKLSSCRVSLSYCCEAQTINNPSGWYSIGILSAIRHYRTSLEFGRPSKLLSRHLQFAKTDKVGEHRSNPHLNL